ncbi:CPSF A subunit region-domain-containing protein [Kickxella alabastrina]|uniref:CPSF A subunit region-domain-containing protein n=1 Tax=Kickxella alabastrina TaxID=61397 RepID=UPI0022201539|nr:CPSF A subunit region-domain-containing protein [Kickxella alabastrina]KAI7823465.1 CPSF A subunit region-domain-containing protein [Kickxella alabastrina]
MPGMIGDLDDLYAETGHSQRRKPGAGRFTARKQRKRTENNPGSRDDNGEDDDNDDDDFDALYDEDEGEDAGADGSVPSSKAPAESPGDTADNADGEGVRGESPMYALVALANGDLSVFRLPHFDRAWTTARFDSLADTLVDTLAASAPMAEQESRAESRIDQFRLVQLGGDDISTALLVVLTTAGELAVYRAFSHCSPEYAKAVVEQAAPAAAAGTAAAAAACGDDTGLALRFTRVAHDVLAYEPDYERRVQRVQARQTRVFDAWTRRDRERMAREAKAQARAKQQQHRDAAVAATAVDWGESDEDDEAAEGGQEQPAADGGAHDAAAAESDAAKDGDGDGDGDGNDTAMGGEEQMPDLDLIDAQIGDRAVAPTRKITVLGNLGGYAAVFVAALQPAIVLVGAKRYARVHPVRVPARLPAVLTRITKDADAAGLLTPWQPIVGTARFHSAACPHGLIALTQAGTLVIGALPAPASAALRGGVEFDAPWPVRCLPVGTRHVGLSALGGVVFHRPSGSYAVAAAVPEPFALKEPNCEVAARQALEDGVDSVDDTQVIPEHKRRDVRTTSAPPLQPHAHVDLLSPVTWETVDSYALERNEHVAALESLELESAQSVGGRRAVVCVGTGFVLGEDVASRGRVLIFDVIDVVPLPGRPQTNRRLKLLCQEELRGTVTALGELRGNLAVSVGSKVFVRSLQRNEQLVSVAFLDCATWVRSLAGLNSLLLVGDLTAGLCLAGFQDEGPTRIQVLARDASSHLPIEHAEYAVLGHHMQLLAADTLGALHFFSYAPHDAQSAGGQRLLRRGEFNLRSRVAAVRRLVGMPRLGAEPSQPQHVCLVATAAGAVHAVSMVSEKTFKRLHRITTQMVHAVAPLAALNPREFRAVPLHRRQHHAPRRTVLDADLLAPLFAHGPLERQRDAAQRNGTTPDRVLRDIVETERAFAFF